LISQYYFEIITNLRAYGLPWVLSLLPKQEARDYGLVLRYSVHHSQKYCAVTAFLYFLERQSFMNYISQLYAISGFYGGENINYGILLYDAV
jgi:hypothetical protein